MPAGSKRIVWNDLNGIGYLHRVKVIAPSERPFSDVRYATFYNYRFNLRIDVKPWRSFVKCVVVHISRTGDNKCAVFVQLPCDILAAGAMGNINAVSAADLCSDQIKIAVGNIDCFPLSDCSAVVDRFKLITAAERTFADARYAFGNAHG